MVAQGDKAISAQWDAVSPQSCADTSPLSVSARVGLCPILLVLTEPDDKCHLVSSHLPASTGKGLFQLPLCPSAKDRDQHVQNPVCDHLTESG